MTSALQLIPQSALVLSDRTSESCPFTHLRRSAIALSLTQITQLAQAIAFAFCAVKLHYQLDWCQRDRSTTYPTARASIKRSHFLLHKLHN
jgi:hypothetical protein